MTGKEKRDDIVEDGPLDWSVKLADCLDGELSGQRVADDAERAQLLAAIADPQLIAIEALRCSYVFRRKPGTATKGRAVIEGRFEIDAQLIQTCVLTLEPVETSVHESFQQDFTEAATDAPAPSMPEVDPDDPFADEPPVESRDGRLVFGDLVYDYFVTGIDPNPRKQGVSYETDGGPANGGNGAATSPFAVLKELKRGE